MNQKGFINIILVGVVVVLVGIAGYFTLLKKSEPMAQQPATTLQTNTETPAVEGDVTDQPAYLVAAYSKNGKNYIDVDYVELVYGEAGAKAKLEDGNCVIPYCEESDPGPYRRNRNPKIRTFEVSPTVFIGDNSIPTEHPLPISFKTLEDYSLGKNKIFITINTKNSIVIKILKPYHP